jgi:arginase
MSRDAVLIGVPIDCIGAPTADGAAFGCELAPAALRASGVVEALGAADDGDLGVRLIGRGRDSATGILGWPGVVEVTSAVRAKVHEVVAAGQLPVILGGCCTLLPGALAGARDSLGSVGMAHMDGHLDLYDGQTSPTGEPADMPISVVCGHGPEAWSVKVGAPVVAPDRIVLLGPRDREEAAALGSALPEQLGIGTELTPADLRSEGPAAVGRATRDRFEHSSLPYWVHVDVDVLDEREFPATDYLMPGGLALTELTEMLGQLTRSPGLIGFSLACYNPQKDAALRNAASLVELLREVLGSADDRYVSS